LAGVVVGFGLAVTEAIKIRKKKVPDIPYSTTYFDKLIDFKFTGTQQNIKYSYINDTDKIETSENNGEYNHSSGL